MGPGRTGTLTVIQRFGGGLNLNVHFHTLVLDGMSSARVVGLGHSDPAAPGLAIAPEPSDGTRAAPRAGRHHWAWAQLMQRAFGIDMLACPRCNGRPRLVATVEDPQAVRALLESLELPAAVPQPAPPRPP